MKKINVAIIGASGYTGLELIKILISHPGFNISYISTSEGDSVLSNIHLGLKNVFDMDVSKTDSQEIAKSADLAILALPHKTAMKYAKELLDFGVKVIDLSADYRLNLKNYEEHYCAHEDKENLKHAIYGLPELNRKKIKTSNLIANPGCYPTGSILAILPFLKYLDEKYPIIIDAKSGVTGAGKTPNKKTHFISVNENFTAYNPFSHRHSPEISEKINQGNQNKFEVLFVPHLLPVNRGILTSVYLRLKEEINASKLLEEFYNNEYFVRSRNEPVCIKNVVGTNFCDIFSKSQGRNLFVNSSIDNLLRGASSQAIVNANLMFGFEENLGIPIVPHGV